LKGFPSDFVEFEHNEGDKDFTKIPQYNKTDHSLMMVLLPKQLSLRFIILWNFCEVIVYFIKLKCIVPIVLYLVALAISHGKKYFLENRIGKTMEYGNTFLEYFIASNISNTYFNFTMVSILHSQLGTNQNRFCMRYPSIRARLSTYLYANFGHLKIKLFPKR